MNFFKPKFWDKNQISFFSILLFPITLLVKLLSFFKRFLTKTHHFSIPIICVGNIYLGGTGKTPLCIEIFSILNNNIKTYNLEERVDLVEGRSGDVDVLEKITPTLEKEPIGLLIIDADGNVARDLNIYLQYVRKGGYLVIDDYVMRSHYKDISDKATPTQEAIHGLVNYGVARSLGVYPWGTWFGQKL